MYVGGGLVQLRKAVKSVIVNNYAHLSQLLKSQGTLQQFAHSLFQDIDGIPHDVVLNPTYDCIMNCFVSVLSKVEDIEALCYVFTKALDGLGSTGLSACSQTLASEWRMAAKKIGYDVNFLKEKNGKIANMYC